MNTQLLIESIVRQTTVLIAQLATSGGLRAPLSGIANQVFLDLAAELERQGVSRKVSADMFGLALRGYQRKLQRLTESRTDTGRSLWEAVLDYVSEGKVRTRGQILQRFHGDDETQVRSVLHDLTESGLVFCSGSGANAAFRAATDAELGDVRQALGTTGVEELLWLVVYREGPMTLDALEQRTKIERDLLDGAIARLSAAGRVRPLPDSDPVLFKSGEFVVPLSSPVGFEAAVLDHFQAAVTTICARLRGATPQETGGSTYTFVVWPGHPMRDEVCEELRSYRDRKSALRTKVDTYNREHGIPEQYERVLSYAGQCVLETETQDETA